MCSVKKEEKYNYGFSVERHKNERYELMREFYRQAAEIDEMLDRMRGNKKIPINFDDLDKFDLNIMQNLNSKVTLKKTYSTEKKIVFETLMLKGGEFGWHSHSDCSEIVEVESGIMYDSITDKDYQTGDTAIFLSGQAHTPIALENTYLIVTFLRD
tara:strand:- start:231 stop:698 length:468 start_codon:yes stop_codon:yes gene_type:complete